MKLRVFLLLALFFSSFGVYAVSQSDAMASCNKDLNGYWVPSGVPGSCNDDTTSHLIKLVTTGGGGWDAGSTLGSYPYDPPPARV